MCHNCHESGAELLAACDACDGLGVVEKRRTTDSNGEPFYQVHNCKRCNGRGTQVLVTCPVCDGQGLLGETKTLSVSIPRGVSEQHEIRLIKEGNMMRDGIHQDLVLRIVEKKVPGWRRVENDLFWVETITPHEVSSMLDEGYYLLI